MKEVHVGDKCETCIIGKTTEKCSCNTTAIGAVDELNSFLGMAKSKINDSDLKNILEKIQGDLFLVGSGLAGSSISVSEENVKWIENNIVNLEKDLPQLKNFILPGGSEASADLHVARSVCRRAEREIVSFSKEEEINPEILKYINRLSDLLFTLARKVDSRNKIEEKTWNHK